MYRKDLVKKAAGATAACILTIGLNAAVSGISTSALCNELGFVDPAVVAEQVAARSTMAPVVTPELTTLPAETVAPKSAARVAEDATGAAVASGETVARITEAPAKKSSKTTKVARQFRNTGISVAGDYVNIRKAPNTESKIKGKLYRGSAAKILKTKGAWVKVSSGSVTGYIKKEYLATGAKAERLADKFGKTYAVVKKGTETLNVREKKSTDAGIVAQISDGDSCVVKGIGSEWVKVKVNGTKTGYVAREYVFTRVRFGKAVSIAEEKKEEEQAQKSSDSGSSSAASASVSGNRGSSVASYALNFVGNPYVWGGTSLTGGADCSGFTMSIYAKFGYSLPHSSAAQAGHGRSVSLSALQPGDLVFYRHGSRIGHVAIYIGGGRIVHAAGKKWGIMTSSVNYRSPYCARRIIG